MATWDYEYHSRRLRLPWDAESGSSSPLPSCCDVLIFLDHDHHDARQCKGKANIYSTEGLFSGRPVKKFKHNDSFVCGQCWWENRPHLTATTIPTNQYTGGLLVSALGIARIRNDNSSFTCVHVQLRRENQFQSDGSSAEISVGAAVAVASVVRHTDTVRRLDFDRINISIGALHSSPTHTNDVNHQHVTPIRKLALPCDTNEGLWKFKFTTDDYPCESSRQLTSLFSTLLNIIASGPPPNQN
eukprot:scaffold13945_cov234-Alexandrium_tamarense.AAC.1